MIRRLATIRTITNLLPIPDADLIELAKVDGWQVVVKKGEFEVGDTVVYFEIDSWIPERIAPFLSKGKLPKLFNNVWGERLRTIKLKGQLSQGLIIPCRDEYFEFKNQLDEYLGIQLYEKPLPAQLAGKAKGNFPPFIPKTDQERIQNIPMGVFAAWMMDDWEVTEKLDGSSMTIYLNKNKFGICSRNLELELDQENNAFVNEGKQYEERLREWGLNIAIQGELIGPGIQDNQYGLAETAFYVFDIFDINNQKYFTPSARHEAVIFLDMHHVPIVGESKLGDATKADIIRLADGQSFLNESNREGLVFKSINSIHSFKTISNKWLLNERN